MLHDVDPTVVGPVARCGAVWRDRRKAWAAAPVPQEGQHKRQGGGAMRENGTTVRGAGRNPQSPGLGLVLPASVHSGKGPPGQTAQTPVVLAVSSWVQPGHT